MQRSKFLYFILLACFVPSLAWASPDRTGKVDAGIHLSGAVSTDDVINSGFYIGGNVAYGISEWFAVGFSAGGQSLDSDDETVAGVTIPGPDFIGVPLFGELIVRAPTGEQPFNPYAVLGLGTVIWDVDDVTTSNGILLETDIDNDFAVKVGGGIDWFVNDNWILNFEAAYVFNSPETSVTASAGSISATAVDDVDLDYWSVGGGIKYLFS